MTEIVFEPDRVRAGMVAILTAVSNAATAVSADLPTRQIVGVGTIPHDCEQVVVRATQVATGAPESARGGSGTYPNAGANVTLYTVTAQVEIVRKSCTTMTGPRNDQPPTPEKYLDNLALASADTAILLSAAAELANDLLGLDTGATRRTVVYGAPSGGLFSTSLRIDTVV